MLRSARRGGRAAAGSERAAPGGLGGAVSEGAQP